MPEQATIGKSKPVDSPTGSCVLFLSTLFQRIDSWPNRPPPFIEFCAARPQRLRCCQLGLSAAKSAPADTGSTGKTAREDDIGPHRVRTCRKARNQIRIAARQAVGSGTVAASRPLILEAPRMAAPQHLARGQPDSPRPHHDPQSRVGNGIVAAVAARHVVSGKLWRPHCGIQSFGIQSFPAGKRRSFSMDIDRRGENDSDACARFPLTPCLKLIACTGRPSLEEGDDDNLCQDHIEPRVP